MATIYGHENHTGGSGFKGTTVCSRKGTQISTLHIHKTNCGPREREIHQYLGTQDPIERAVMWKKTRTSSKTCSLRSSSEEGVSQRIDALFKELEDGPFIEHRKEDVLTVALQTPEHPGRVRFKGTYATQTSVFGRPIRQHWEFHEETIILKEAYEQKISTLKQQLLECDRLYERRFMELENRFQRDDVPIQNFTSPSNIPTNLSGNTEFSTPIHPPHPSRADVSRKLLMDPDGQVVAEGQLIATESTFVHGRPLDPDHSRVSITLALHPFALLLVPVGEELVTVGQALNTMVAWPNTLILDANMPTPHQMPAAPRRKPDTSNRKKLKKKKTTTDNIFCIFKSFTKKFKCTGESGFFEQAYTTANTMFQLHHTVHERQAWTSGGLHNTGEGGCT